VCLPLSLLYESGEGTGEQITTRVGPWVEMRENREDQKTREREEWRRENKTKKAIEALCGWLRERMGGDMVGGACLCESGIKGKGI
jgi:hypothetical protein